MRMAYCDLSQAESRTLGAIIYRLFGDTVYLDVQECGDPHSLICAMGWKNLPWPKDFNLTALASMPGRKFPPDLMKTAKAVADREYYRGKSYRDMAKTLAHGCLTADHEVCTPEAWVPIRKKPPIIMDGSGQFVPVSNWIDKEYYGLFVEWENEHISIKMTEDHKIFYITQAGYLHECAAGEAPKYTRILLSKQHRINEPSSTLRRALQKDVTYLDRARVYCPTVPDGSFYIRRNGSIVLTGNSNYFGKPATMASHTHTDVKIISAFQRAYFSAFPFIPRWHQWVQYQLETTATIVTMLGRRRKFLGRPDDPATLREMIAFEPQSVATGDYMNAGMLAVWGKNLPFWLHKQVHDALAFSYDRRDEDWLIPEVCSTLSWPITLTAHPDQLARLQTLPRRSRREAANLQALLALTPREFRIPVEAEVGWDLARRKPNNPNGLITWRAGTPDTRRRLPTKALTAVERLSLSLGYLNGNDKKQ